MAIETEQVQETRETGSPAAGAGSTSGAPVPSQGTLPALSISGVVVNRAELVLALSIYIPQLTDVRMLDGDRFVLDFAPQPKEK